MPADFDACRARPGSRIRTKKLPNGRYIPICYDKSGSHAGHVKRKKGAK